MKFQSRGFYQQLKSNNMNNANQPINPTTYSRVGNGDDDFEPLLSGKKTGFEKQFGGLTKREYASMLAMQGLLSNSNTIDTHSELELKWVAEHAVKQADELLKQLEQK